MNLLVGAVLPHQGALSRSLYLAVVPAVADRRSFATSLVVEKSVEYRLVRPEHKASSRHP